MTSVSLLSVYDANVVYAYTRAQAIDDGVLVDVSETAREAGFCVPVALTQAVWEDCVAWTDNDCRNQTYQDESGRLWDVLYMTYIAAKRSAPGRGHIVVTMYRVPRDGKSHAPKPCHLKAVIGPGDEGEPVVTIMMPTED